MMKKIGAAALAALFLCGSARAMSAAEFIAKADSLKAKGMMAMFSSDLGLLKAEFATATKAWKAQAHRPNACPPPGAQKIDTDAIYSMVAAVPVPQRTSTNAVSAIVAGLNRKFPCR